MKKSTMVIALVLVALLATFSVVAASESKTIYRAHLAEAGTGSAGHGNAVFLFSGNGSEMTYKLVVNNLQDTTMAHIHVAAEPGGDGPPVVWLYPDAPPSTLIPGVFNGLLGSRKTTPEDLTGAAGIADFDQLQMAIAEGRAYVNVHTTTFPGGEIRGTIE